MTWSDDLTVPFSLWSLPRIVRVEPPLVTLGTLQLLLLQDSQIPVSDREVKQFI